MIDKNYCMSSYLAFRYIVDDNIDFYEGLHHRPYHLIPENQRILVHDEHDIDREIQAKFDSLKGKKLGLMLSGGMDSACLASYMPGADAYTFRFIGGEYEYSELKRAEYFAEYYGLHLHYVEINWKTVTENLDILMNHKGAPLHSIEPQIYQAALQAESDGVEEMIIGDGADCVFGGTDKLLSKDWKYEEFKKRYTYVDPEAVLVDPVDIDFAYKKYRQGEDGINFIGFLADYSDIESYASYENAFSAAGMVYTDPYEILKMDEPLDLKRIRNGESKYLIRALFKMKYPGVPVPEKNPMPRPVDQYFKNWKGPTRPEFKPNLSIEGFTGNQKWLLWCLECFLNNHE
jgi:hypothetical protein